jgi:hypothetical protein
MCCQRYGHTKNYCHLKPGCVKCAGYHSTTQCPRKERSSDVRCVLCGGNHPANYKGCTVYKDLQQKTFPPLRPKIYTPPPHLKQTLHTQSGVTYAQVTKHNSSAPPPYTDDEPHTNISLPHHYHHQASLNKAMTYKSSKR